MLAFAHNTSALTIGDTQELGYVWPGVPSGNAQRTIYVNHLVGMALGSLDVANGQISYRSNNAFGSLPTAVWALNGTGTKVNLGGGGLYTYLFARYDGSIFGAEVWYVGNLSGIITIPAIGGGCRLVEWTLVGPGVSGVPDGGTTAMLLGAALGALGMARRVLKISLGTVPRPMSRNMDLPGSLKTARFFLHEQQSCWAASWKQKPR